MNTEKKCCNEHNNHECGCGNDHSHDDHEHNCGCGCGEGEVETITVELEDENGNVITCEIIDGFEHNNKEYAVVHNPSDETLYLFEVVGEGEVGELVLPSEEEFDEVSKYYESLVEMEE